MQRRKILKQGVAVANLGMIPMIGSAEVTDTQFYAKDNDVTLLDTDGNRIKYRLESQNKINIADFGSRQAILTEDASSVVTQNNAQNQQSEVYYSANRIADQSRVDGNTYNTQSDYRNLLEYDGRGVSPMIDIPGPDLPDVPDLPDIPDIVEDDGEYKEDWGGLQDDVCTLDCCNSHQWRCLYWTFNKYVAGLGKFALAGYLIKSIGKKAARSSNKWITKLGNNLTKDKVVGILDTIGSVAAGDTVVVGGYNWDQDIPGTDSKALNSSKAGITGKEPGPNDPGLTTFAVTPGHDQLCFNGEEECDIIEF